jgi:hypothetical protein
MALVQEGTTRLGFRCDSKGCLNKATHTPIICIPPVGYPIEFADRLFVFSHICMEHRQDALRTDYVGPKMQRLARSRAAALGLKPDFDRWGIEWWPCISFQYQKFLIAAEIVPPDDAQVKGEIIAP